MDFNHQIEIDFKDIMQNVDKDELLEGLYRYWSIEELYNQWLSDTEKNDLKLEIIAEYLQEQEELKDGS